MKSKNIAIHRGAAAILLAAMMSSCAAMTNPNATAAVGADGGANKAGQFQADQQNTVNQGTALGGLIGGGAGALLRQQFGVGGMIAGALIGAAIGNGVGQHVAAQKAQAAYSEANLNMCVKEAAEVNATARQSIQNLNGKLASLDDKIKAAKARGDSGALQSYKKDLLSMQATANKAYTLADGEVQAQNGAISKDSRYSGLSSGVTTLSSTRDEARKTQAHIASLLKTIDG